MCSLDNQFESDQTKEMNKKMAGIDLKDMDCSRLVLISKLFLVKKTQYFKLLLLFTKKSPR